MKWKSMWWGVQIKAETEDDKGILRKLYDSLPKELMFDGEAYDTGTLEIIKTPANYDVDGFTNIGLLTIEFKR